MSLRSHSPPPGHAALLVTSPQSRTDSLQLLLESERVRASQLQQQAPVTQHFISPVCSAWPWEEVAEGLGTAAHRVWGLPPAMRRRELRSGAAAWHGKAAALPRLKAGALGAARLRI